MTRIHEMMKFLSARSLYEELMGYPPEPLKEPALLLIQTMGEHVGEALAWARSAEDAVETGDYVRLRPCRRTGTGEHAFACVGYTLRASRRALEKAKSDLEAKHPEAFQ